MNGCTFQVGPLRLGCGPQLFSFQLLEMLKPGEFWGAKRASMAKYHHVSHEKMLNLNNLILNDEVQSHKDSQKTKKHTALETLRKLL